MSMVQNSSLSVYTQIATYTVAAEHQQAVLEVLLAETNRWLSHQPGFLTANCYPSEDGRRVVSHVEWRTQQVWQNAQQSPEQHVLRARMSALPGTTLQGRVFSASRPLQNACALMMVVMKAIRLAGLRAKSRSGSHLAMPTDEFQGILKRRS